MGFGYQVSAFPSEHKNRQSPHFPHPAPHSIRSGRRSREFPSNFPVVGRPRWSSLGGAACTPPGVSWDVKREVMAQSGWGEISAPPGEDPAAKAAREPGRAAEQRGTGHAQERGEGRGSRGCAQTRPTPQVCTQDNPPEPRPSPLSWAQSLASSVAWGVQLWCLPYLSPPLSQCLPLAWAFLSIPFRSLLSTT